MLHAILRIATVVAQAAQANPLAASQIATAFPLLVVASDWFAFQ